MLQSRVVPIRYKRKALTIRVASLTVFKSNREKTQKIKEVGRSHSQVHTKVLLIRSEASWKSTESRGDPIHPQAGQPICVIRRDRHLHTNYVESMSGVPSSLNQGIKKDLPGGLSRLWLHKLLKTRCFHKETGQRSKSHPPLEDLSKVTSRHVRAKRLHK